MVNEYASVHFTWTPPSLKPLLKQMNHQVQRGNASPWLTLWFWLMPAIKIIASPWTTELIKGLQCGTHFDALMPSACSHSLHPRAA